MPRLPVWFCGTAFAGAMHYIFYSQYYLPRHASPHACDPLLSAERLHERSLHQRLALLRHRADSPAGPLSAGRATNRARLSLYGELQQLRARLFALPRRAQPAAAKAAALRALSAVEARHCAALRFRDEAPRLWQRLACLLGLAAFALCFGLVDAAARRLTGGGGAAERARRAALHGVARGLLRLLGIRAVMTVEEEREEVGKEENAPGLWEGEKGGRGGKADLGGSKRGKKEGEEEEALYMVFAPQHWIEVVGFWGCAENPLLTSSRVQLLQSSQRDKVGSVPRATALPYELYWHRQWLQLQRDMQNPVMAEEECASIAPAFDENALKQEESEKLDQTADDVPVTSSFGYPLASQVFMGKEASSPNILPVAVTGLPSVLFLGDAFAQPDVSVGPTAHETFTDVHERQFYAHKTEAADDLLSKKSDEKAAADVEAIVSRRWPLGCPFWHRSAWAAVYGGESRAGSEARRELIFRVGRRCRASELMSVQTELQKELFEEA